MILSQFNPIRLYTDKRSRQWQPSNAENITDMVFIPKGQIPALQLIVDWAYPPLLVSVFDKDDNPVNSTKVGAWTMAFDTDGNSYNRVYTVGNEYSNADDLPEFVYIAISNGEETFYSDVFRWVDEAILTESYLKVKLESSDIRMGKNGKYRYNFNSFIPEFYLNADVLSEEPKIDQSASDSEGLTIPAFGTRTISREFNIDSNRQIWLYLSALNLLLANGSVEVTWNYETYYPTQIDVSKEEGHGNGLYQVKLSIIDASESVSMSNEIV